MAPRREDTARQRIIAFALERFTKEGFQRISVDDIASELRISKKTFYKYFSGKDDLVSHVLDSVLGDFHRNISEVHSGRHDFITKFGLIMELLGRTTNRLSRPFIRDLQQRLPHLWGRLEAFRREGIQTNLSALIDQGIREKQIRPTLNTKVFLSAYLASIESIISPSFLMNESLSSRDAVRSILEIFFQGALAPVAARRLARKRQHFFQEDAQQ